MRTTVTIDDRLLELAKQLAHEQHTTLGAVVSEAPQRQLASVPAEPGPPLPEFTRGTGLRPGIDWRSNAAMCAAMDG